MEYSVSLDFCKKRVVVLINKLAAVDWIRYLIDSTLRRIEEACNQNDEDSIELALLQ